MRSFDLALHQYNGYHGLVTIALRLKAAKTPYYAGFHAPLEPSCCDR